MLAQKQLTAKPVNVARPARACVRPIAMKQQHKQQQQKAATAGLASLAAFVSAAPADAANVITNVASATEGYPFVPPAWAPQLFVPLTGILLPAVGMAWAFTYIQKERQ